MKIKTTSQFFNNQPSISSTKEKRIVINKLRNAWSQTSISPDHQILLEEYFIQLSSSLLESEAEYEIELTQSRKTFLFTLAQLADSRKSILEDLQDKVMDFSLSNFKTESQMNAICKQIKRLRQVNLFYCQTLLNIHNYFNRHIGNEIPCQSMIKLFENLQNDNNFLIKSLIRKYIVFSKGYDPFLLKHYELLKKTNDKRLKQLQSIEELFEISANEAFRMNKVQNQIIKYLKINGSDICVRKTEQLSRKRYLSHFKGNKVSQRQQTNKDNLSHRYSQFDKRIYLNKKTLLKNNPANSSNSQVVYVIEQNRSKYQESNSCSPRKRTESLVLPRINSIRSDKVIEEEISMKQMNQRKNADSPLKKKKKIQCSMNALESQQQQFKKYVFSKRFHMNSFKSKSPEIRTRRLAQGEKYLSPENSSLDRNLRTISIGSQISDEQFLKEFNEVRLLDSNRTTEGQQKSLGKIQKKKVESTFDKKDTVVDKQPSKDQKIKKEVKKEKEDKSNSKIQQEKETTNHIQNQSFPSPNNYQSENRNFKKSKQTKKQPIPQKVIVSNSDVEEKNQNQNLRQTVFKSKKVYQEKLGSSVGKGSKGDNGKEISKKQEMLDKNNNKKIYYLLPSERPETRQSILLKLQNYQIKSEYREKCQYGNWKLGLSHNQYYFHKSYINNQLLAVSLCCAIPSGDITVKYWGPLTCCDQQTSNILFSHYLEHIQKKTLLKNIYYNGQFLRELSLNNFIIQKQRIYVRNRVNPSLVQSHQYTYFLNVKFSNLAIHKDTEKQEELIIQEDIQWFDSNKFVIFNYLLVINKLMTPGIFSQIAHYHPKISLPQVEEALLSYYLPTDAYNPEFKCLSFNLLAVQFQAQIFSALFVAYKGLILFLAGQTYFQSKQSIIVCLPMNKYSVKMYFGKGFSSTLNMVQAFKSQAHRVRQKIEFSVRMFKKQLRGPLNCINLKNQNCYGDLEINFLWKDYLQGQIIHDMTKFEAFDQKFYCLIQVEKQILCAFEVLPENFIQPQ